MEEPGEEAHEYLQHAQVIEHRGERGKENYHWKNLENEDEANGSGLSGACRKWSKQEHRTAL
jgi:hypothetical protein